MMSSTDNSRGTWSSQILLLAVGIAASTLGGAACSSDAPPGPGQTQASTGGAPVATGGTANTASGGNSASGGAGAPTLGTGGTVGASSGGQSSGGVQSTAGAGGASTNTGGQAGMNGTGGSAGTASGAAGTAGASAGGTAGASSGGGGASGGVGGAKAGSGGAGGTAGANGGSSTAGTAGAGGGVTRPARVLLYSFSTLDIPSVPAQLTLFKQKLEGLQYQVDQSKDPAVFTDANLEKYAAVGMINTCFSPFGANKSGAPESQALQKFLQQGGGLFGTHCADVTFQSANPPALYNQLIGGRASSENFDGKSECRKMGDHPTTAQLPATFSYTGNLDATDFIATDTTVLVKCTWGNASAKDVAVSWVRTEGAGRVFYTNFGKVDGDLSNATIGDKHILSGLAWVLGR